MKKNQDPGRLVMIVSAVLLAVVLARIFLRGGELRTSDVIYVGVLAAILTIEISKRGKNRKK